MEQKQPEFAMFCGWRITSRESLVCSQFLTFDVGDRTTENRGVRGSSPGLAIAKRPITSNLGIGPESSWPPDRRWHRHQDARRRSAAGAGGRAPRPETIRGFGRAQLVALALAPGGLTARCRRSSAGPPSERRWRARRRSRRSSPVSSGDAEDRSGYGGAATRCVDGLGARTISAGRQRAQGDANVGAVPGAQPPAADQPRVRSQTSHVERDVSDGRREPHRERAGLTDHGDRGRSQVGARPVVVGFAAVADRLSGE
jgi:hypothetical protein